MSQLYTYLLFYVHSIPTYGGHEFHYIYSFLAYKGHIGVRKNSETDNIYIICLSIYNRYRLSQSRWKQCLVLYSINWCTTLLRGSNSSNGFINLVQSALHLINTNNIMLIMYIHVSPEAYSSIVRISTRE